MAEKRAPIPKSAMLYGMVVPSTVERGVIRHITMGEIEKHLTVVAARDIAGQNRVRVLDNSIPALASSTVSYRGQPILALFGSNNETIQLAARQIAIEYDEGEETAHGRFTPYTYRFGSFEEAIAEEELNVFERTYRFGEPEIFNSSLSRITASFDDKILVISTPSQWPNHVRETVSDITSYPKKRVEVHCQPYYAPHDEMLIRPSALAAIAALGSIKSGHPTQLFSVISSRRPPMTVVRKTWYFPDGRVHAEKVDVEVDMGCSLFFSDEMANQLIVGLTPIYGLSALSITINFTTSARAPAHFWGDLGYSNALASTEAHYSALGTVSGFNPLSWRLKYASESQGHSQVVKTDKFAKLKDLLSEVSQRSDFQRKHAAYEMQAKMKTKLSTLLNYSRGVALTCGAGISGFSSECRSLVQQAVQITLNPNNQVEINTSLPCGGTSGSIWKQIVSEELSVDIKDISFTEDCNALIDSGPAVLSAAFGRMPQQIQRACNLIKEKRFVQPLPISENVLSPRHGGSGGALFTSNTWAAVALELEIDTILLQPVIRSVWASISVPRVFDTHQIESRVRHQIVRTLSELGAVLSNKSSFETSIEIHSEGTEVSTSISSALNGALTSAFASALEQALGSPIAQLPVTGATILATIRGKQP